jgi:hypothetical protein
VVNIPSLQGKKLTKTAVDIMEVMHIKGKINLPPSGNKT